MFCLRSCRFPAEVIINLDLPAHLRYQEIAVDKKQQIIAFLDHLHTITKYKYAFFTAKVLSPWLKWYTGAQFYDECASIASSIGRPVSELIVFNYMYELGAFKNFCTSICVNFDNQSYLARNLDYGFQQYLMKNSIIFNYQKNNQTIFKTVGHVGLIGTHTALRIDGYAATLNERTDQTLFHSLYQILIRKSQTVPYLLMKTMREAETMEKASEMLRESRTCSGVYYILNGDGNNEVIQKSRNRVHQHYKNNDYLVHTNRDRDKPDPDGRRIIAEEKMTRLIESDSLTKQNVWQILTEQPNKNKLTLMTILMETSRNELKAEVWEQQE